MSGSHYPSYSVMREKEHWDEHTQSIVVSRLVRERSYGFLTPEEAEGLRTICSALTNDDRGEIVQYILCHIDETLTHPIGEGQRPDGVPEERRLIRDGLRTLEKIAMERYGRYLFMLETGLARQLVLELSEAELEPTRLAAALPQKPFFQKLLALTVEAYCSHPQIWSEIGYGGPAYPRGYVRTGIGQLDPWEAKTER